LPDEPVPDDPGPVADCPVALADGAELVAGAELWADEAAELVDAADEHPAARTPTAASNAASDVLFMTLIPSIACGRRTICRIAYRAHAPTVMDGS
jgi:hypothetical protein